MESKAHGTVALAAGHGLFVGRLGVQAACLSFDRKGLWLFSASGLLV